MTNDELEAADDRFERKLDALALDTIADIWRARATRAEAHAERLRGENADLLAVCDATAFMAAQTAAHAERLAGALEAFVKTSLTQGLNLGPLVGDGEATLSAYRGVKDEACSRPSDALDAPVADQSTTCSQPEGAEQ